MGFRTWKLYARVRSFPFLAVIGPRGIRFHLRSGQDFEFVHYFTILNTNFTNSNNCTVCFLVFGLKILSRQENNKLKKSTSKRLNFPNFNHLHIYDFPFYSILTVNEIKNCVHIMRVSCEKCKKCRSSRLKKCTVSGAL